LSYAQGDRGGDVFIEIENEKMIQYFKNMAVENICNVYLCSQEYIYIYIPPSSQYIRPTLTKYTIHLSCFDRIFFNNI
jgi:hypothetical protein